MSAGHECLTIETNWQSVNGTLIKLQSDTLNSSDIETLQNIAQQCPHSGGKSVWKARGILNEYYRIPLEYTNDCPMNSERIQETENKINALSKFQSINLYPNPNNGNMSIEYTLKKDACLEITDINGNLVGRYILPATGNKQEIKNDGLINGVYLYRVISDKIIAGKIVIMK